jgi:hypothetical protein
MNLRLDSDWICIQQQAGSGSSKIPGSVSGSSEYGSETVVGTVPIKLATVVVTKNEGFYFSLGNENGCIGCFSLYLR